MPKGRPFAAGCWTADLRDRTVPLTRMPQGTPRPDGALSFRLAIPCPSPPPTRHLFTAEGARRLHSHLKRCVYDYMIKKWGSSDGMLMKCVQRGGIQNRNEPTFQWCGARALGLGTPRATAFPHAH